MNAAQHQEDKYHLPYHWFPEDRLPKFSRQEKQRIVFDMIRRGTRHPVRDYLDVGCGDGRWTTDVHRFLEGCQAGVRGHGVDISSRAIGFARLISPHLDFEDFDGRHLPFEDASFDLATSIEVIEHIEDDSETLHLQEIRRVLRPGGLLVLTTPNHLLPMPPHHLRHYTVERLNELCHSCGLDVIDVRGQTRPLASRWGMLRKHMNRFPFLWMAWRRAMRETTPEEALNLLVVGRRNGR